MKKLKLFSILLFALVASFSAHARIDYTVTCTFSDGTGWEIQTTSENWFGFYSGVCTAQQLQE